MQAYEGYIDDGRFVPVEGQAGIVGRRRVRMTVIDEPKELSEKEKKKILKELCGSITDPTFVEPPEIPLELDGNIEELL
jgi:hypothetical protein